jgi:energy-coupling factor transport system substrate-specific component
MPMDSGLVMLIAGVALLAVGYVAMTRSLSSREIAAVASLGALSAAGRVAFAAIPSVQPSTVLVIVSGWVLGPAAGFAVGATTALVSNVFLGQGPWTVWQMLSWGSIGLVAGLLGRVRTEHSTRWIVVYSVIAGFAFGWAMDAWFWLSFIYPHTVASLMVAVGASAAFDAMHAAGNAVFATLFAARAVELLKQFRARMHVEYVEEVSHA